MNEPREVKAGFVGFGEINTPMEFLEGRVDAAAKLLEEKGLELVRTTLVRDEPDGAPSAQAVRELRDGGDFDLLILCVAGWIPSWAVLAVTESFKHKPMVLWGLSGWNEDDRFVTTADQAGTTALRQPLADMGYRFKYVVNYRDREPRIDEITDYAQAAKTAAAIKTAKIGMGGYRDMRLYGTMYDGVALKKQFGVEIEHFELLELKQLMATADPKEIEAVATEVMRDWDFVKDPKPGTVENSVALYLAIKEKITERGYEVFSYNDVDGIKKSFEFAPAGAMTLLHEKINVSSVPENDSLGAVTQSIIRHLTGQVAAYLEFYEFMENGALMGVPDYVPAEIVDGKITVMPNAFGDFGEGLLNISKLKTGPVTLARLHGVDGRFSMHVALAEARTPIKWEEAGWAPPAPRLPSLEMIFDFPVETFIQNVMSQHYIISYGDNRSKLAEFCALTGVEVIS